VGYVSHTFSNTFYALYPPVIQFRYWEFCNLWVMNPHYLVTVFHSLLKGFNSNSKATNYLYYATISVCLHFRLHGVFNMKMAVESSS
jgi:hypothetical protein